MKNGSPWPCVVQRIKEWLTHIDIYHINNMNTIREVWPWLDCWKAEKENNKE